ncbi:putative transcriptional regulator [Archaeoglobus sulfaticallidus PM70-1]|uniref:Putative transcriptional regulator n=1 Tax=Archaeoglobus sulfaticallidus PM70-1 TaxID=387631 RepID=N0BJM4_9EURY|nr:helix-turn-helix domain-containing protein [Archaeoglobus sulfaticallidus]AGK60691.1 putative transcriptional regulator [Archaeoglobus sulfaticallidus PM70-1]
MKSIKEALTRLNCDNVLECLYGMNEADIIVFKTLVKLRGAKIDTLSKTLGRRENSVYKSLQKLMLAGIVTRDKKTINDGGYYYIYKPVDVEELAKEMIKLLDDWYRRMREVIDEFVALNRSAKEDQK